MKNEATERHKIIKNDICIFSLRFRFIKLLSTISMFYDMTKK